MSQNQAQIAASMGLGALKRLRLTHARPKSLDFVRGHEALEELVLEYVSGVDDLRPVAVLPNLRALHLENLRRMRDFSGLADAAKLRYLSVDGTFDWAQPISSLAFVSSLRALEHFRLGSVRVLAPLTRARTADEAQTTPRGKHFAGRISSRRLCLHRGRNPPCAGRDLRPLLDFTERAPQTRSKRYSCKNAGGRTP